MSSGENYVWGIENRETGRVVATFGNRDSARKYKAGLVDPKAFVLKQFRLNGENSAPKAETSPKVSVATNLEINAYNVIADAIHTGVESGVRHALNKMPAASVVGPSAKEIAEQNFQNLVDQVYIHTMTRLTEIIVFEK